MRKNIVADTRSAGGNSPQQFSAST